MRDCTLPYPDFHYHRVTFLHLVNSLTLSHTLSKKIFKNFQTEKGFRGGVSNINESWKLLWINHVPTQGSVIKYLPSLIYISEFQLYMMEVSIVKWADPPWLVVEGTFSKSPCFMIKDYMDYLHVPFHIKNKVFINFYILERNKCTYIFAFPTFPYSVIIHKVALFTMDRLLLDFIITTIFSLTHIEIQHYN